MWVLSSAVRISSREERSCHLLVASKEPLQLAQTVHSSNSHASKHIGLILFGIIYSSDTIFVIDNQSIVNIMVLKTVWIFDFLNTTMLATYK